MAISSTDDGGGEGDVMESQAEMVAGPKSLDDAINDLKI
jgi:hypothetical protein